MWTWWQWGGGLGWKGCGDHESVENHPQCEAIIAGSLSSSPLRYLHPTSPNPSPLRVASLLPSIIPTSLVRKLGCYLVAPSPLPTSLSPSTFHLSISHPLLPVHWLVYGGWHWANSISRPRQPLRLPECCSLPSMGIPLRRVVTRLFSTLHTSPGLLCDTELSISSSVTPVFHLPFFSLTLTFKVLCVSGEVFQDGLVVLGCFYCTAVPAFSSYLAKSHRKCVS